MPIQSIAVYAPTFPKISEQFIVNQLVALRDGGIRTHIYAHQLDKQLLAAKHSELDGISVHSAPRRAGDWLSKPRLNLLADRGSWTRALQFCKQEISIVARSRRLARSLRPQLAEHDAVFAHFGPSGRATALALKKVAGRRPVLAVMFHGHDVTSYVERYGTRVYEDLFSVADIIFCNSDYTRRQLLRCGADDAKIVEEPVGVTADFMKRYAASWCPPGGIAKIISIGRLVAFKGHEDLLRATAILRPRLQLPFTVEIIGEGPERERLTAEIRRLDLLEVVKLVGECDHGESMRRLESADLCVMPSKRAPDGQEEALGLVAIEAQAIGVPTIVTRSGGLASVVRPGETGLVVPPDQPAALAAAMERMLTDRAFADACSRSGPDWVASRFLQEKINERIIGKLEAVQDSRARAAA